MNCTAQPNTQTTEPTMKPYRLIITIMVTCIVTTAHAQDLTEWFQTARDGDQETIQTFITNGINIEAADADSDGETALMHASSQGHTDIVKLLLANGADIETADENGYTALMMASLPGHTETVEILLANGVNIEAADKFGETALMDASYQGHTDTVEFLLANGADIEAADNKGDTALMAASAGGHNNTIEFPHRQRCRG